MDINQLQKELRAMQRENKKLRRKWKKHYITKDGRHLDDYTIRTIECDFYEDRNGRLRCESCRRFVRQPLGWRSAAEINALIV